MRLLLSFLLAYVGRYLVELAGRVRPKPLPNVAAKAAEYSPHPPAPRCPCLNCFVFRLNQLQVERWGSRFLQREEGQA